MLVVDHYQFQKVGCSEQGLVQNVEDLFAGVHHEEVVTEFEAVQLWLATLAKELKLIKSIFVDGDCVIFSNDY
jgi:hypothetical protein